MQTQQINIKIFLIFITLVFSACEKSQPFPENSPFDGELTLANGKKVSVHLADTDIKRTSGLSGVLPTSFNKNQGLFFIYPKSTTLSFWMPDTYFNLDIIYFDKDLKIVKITRNLPHHPGYSNAPPIPKDKPVFGKYVLEVRADSNLTVDLKTDSKITWHGKKPLPFNE